jgi:hypothetical protein
MNIARASKLKGEDIIVLSRRGSTDTLMLDGQVGLKVSAIQQRLLYWHAASIVLALRTSEQHSRACCIGMLA